MIFRVAWKSFLFITHILVFIMANLIWRQFLRDPLKRRAFYTRIVSYFCGRGLRFMKFKINVINLPPAEKNFLLVGNHLGMLDILVLSSIKPSLFITSMEMKNTPFLGLLTELGGCLYVERRSRDNISGEINEIRLALEQGFSVGLYPEGTSTDGRQVLPFKKSLLVSGAGTGVPVLPMVINYRRVNGEPMSDKWRDNVFWYGDQTFLGAMLRIFELKSVEVDLEFLDPLVVQSEEQRREIAALLQAQISAKYTPIV